MNSTPGTGVDSPTAGIDDRDCEDVITSSSSVSSASGGLTIFSLLSSCGRRAAWTWRLTRALKLIKTSAESFSRMLMSETQGKASRKLKVEMKVKSVHWSWDTSDLHAKRRSWVGKPLIGDDLQGAKTSPEPSFGGHGPHEGPDGARQEGDPWSVSRHDSQVAKGLHTVCEHGCETSFPAAMGR